MSAFTFPQCLRGPNETLFNGTAASMPPSWEHIRSFSVRACWERDGETVSGVPEHEAQFFSVYAFNIWDASECITDTTTQKQARLIATMLEVTRREEELRRFKAGMGCINRRLNGGDA